MPKGPIIYDALPKDDPNGVIDRFTVFPDPDRPEYLGCSLGGRAFSQWGELAPGSGRRGLGRRVTLDELDPDTRAHIIHRIED